MCMLRWMMLAGASILAVAPTVAQRYDPNYPVCLQKWGEGGGSNIDCSYTSLDQCRATASGLSAQCYANPYWPQASHASPPHRRQRRVD
jgi:Tfp pilus assembly protein PilV